MLNLESCNIATTSSIAEFAVGLQVVSWNSAQGWIACGGRPPATSFAVYSGRLLESLEYVRG